MAKDKAGRPKARLPRGFADRSPAEIRRVAQMNETIRKVYERWGFEPVETPLIEYADALGKFLPDEDRPNEGVFAFQDDDEQWLSLRYDLTAPLARLVAEHFDRLPKPYKSYRAGWVFRNEKPGPGRFRQFMQFDADIVGAASPLADAEICMMAADTMEALGFERGEYVIRFSSRGLLDSILEDMGLGGTAQTGCRLAILRAIDKYDRLGSGGVRELLTSGRIDESGDRTPGVGLSLEEAQTLLQMLGLIPTVVTPAAGAPAPEARGVERRPTDTAREIQKGYSSETRFRLLSSKLHECGYNTRELDRIRCIIDACGSAGYFDDRVRFDPTVVRGLEYYTGPVFEAELTFETTDETGRPVRFGSVGGGGRYDGLVGRFRGDDVPATGFSVGVSRLAAALSAREGAEAAKGPVVVTVMDRDALPAYQELTAKLRAALNPPDRRDVVPVEMYVGDSGFRAQMKYADRRNAPCVVIQGSEERAAGKVQIKDLAAGKEASKDIADRREWVAARPAQVKVDDDVETIAAAVRTILDDGR